MRYPKLLAACLLLAVVLPVQAGTKRALVVGVWNYPHLSEHLQLRGPKNDVVVMRELLQQRGFAAENIHLLADEVAGSQGSPTRQAILDALQALTEQVQPGDFTYLHFGGHGTQQPAGDDADEPDGLDEVFLPADTKGWNDTIASVENAITDNTIHQALEGIRARGGFVWVVFDSCHSGTMTRGVNVDEVRYRKVSPTALGIPEAALQKAAQSAVRSRGAGGAERAPFMDVGASSANGQGGMVAFFAAQTTQTTPEMRLPLGDPARQSMGLFSFTLSQVLASSPGASYRQVAQQIIEEYARYGQTVTPMFAGDALDDGVFGDAPVKATPQWRVVVDGDLITAKGGSLHQLSRGAVLALLPRPTATDNEVLGYLEVVDTELLSSTLRPLAHAGKPALELTQIETGNYARLAVANIQLRLRVARLPAEQAATESGKRVLATMERLAAAQRDDADEAAAALLVDWVNSSDDADIRLAVCHPEIGNVDAAGDPRCAPGGEQLWLLPPSGELIAVGARKTHSIGLNKTDDQLQQVLSDSLKGIAKFHNLLRLARHTGAGMLGDAQVRTEILVQRKASGETETIRAGSQPTFHHGDRLLLQFRNLGAQPADVTVLFLDSAYGIEAVFPRGGRANRIEACKTPTQPDSCPGLKLPAGTVNANTVGIERILVISVEAQEAAPRADFTFLAQRALARSRSVTPGAANPLTELFRQAGFGQGPRSRGLDMPAPAAAAVDMQLFSWTTAQ